MSKRTKTDATEPTTGTEPTVAAEQPTTTAPVQVIKLTGKAANFKAGSARDLWFQRVAAYDGKPLADYVADATKSPPSLPEKGKATGKLESVPGWARWFAKQGLVNIIAQ
jgi:hypothetical protein